mmetsp:Transcript_7392/g.12269  ORF Transcript_7392/g.12269 Transcript_7392/m.12269 type:complete len:336 (+) Transcript_7392:2321-3328(+)
MLLLNVEIKNINIVEGWPQNLLAKPVIMRIRHLLVQKERKATHVLQELTDCLLVFFARNGWMCRDGTHPMSLIVGSNVRPFRLGQQTLTPAGAPDARLFGLHHHHRKMEADKEDALLSLKGWSAGTIWIDSFRNDRLRELAILLIDSFSNQIGLIASILLAVPNIHSTGFHNFIRQRINVQSAVGEIAEVATRKLRKGIFPQHDLRRITVFVGRGGDFRFLRFRIGHIIVVHRFASSSSTDIFILGTGSHNEIAIIMMMNASRLAEENNNGTSRLPERIGLWSSIHFNGRRIHRGMTLVENGDIYPVFGPSGRGKGSLRGSLRGNTLCLSWIFVS